ncbi:activator of HSP90 ATPase [Cohnella xylanilytica]|uniref:SRPBCC family protein n=1 Tax=Cohnella xylanilytica TaxID=557555 RepID=UPI001B0B6BBA|nr:SRPBCC family protein [Cohnella xylanilytica]GIO13023.1 activator of HSP90 ATPase [Cohnella xylanilytica]
MNERSSVHDTFVIERVYDATADKVYAAWSDPAAKAGWFQKAEQFEFRVGGREYSRGGPPEGPVFTFDAVYQDIVPNERIVYTYTLDMGETRISVSTTTIELKPEEGGTRLIFTEQGIYLDGHDNPAQREQGTKEMLDTLGEALKKQA